MNALVSSLAVLVSFCTVEAAPVKVRLAEGNARGFLVLRTLEGTAIASGELRQEPTGAAVTSRLLLNFQDGSRYAEVVTFSQTGVFRLEAYRLLQRGPSMPRTDVAFDRKSGRYQASTQEKTDEEAKTASGQLDMPADLYNGMALVLLKNLPAGVPTTVQMAAFLPKPRIIRMVLSPEGHETVFMLGEPLKVTRYLVKLEIGGLAGVLASLIGKEPPDLRYWFVVGEVPAFVRSEGAMFLNGPVWRIEQTLVQWPKNRPR